MDSVKSLVRFLVQSNFLVKAPEDHVFSDQPLGVLACLDRQKICSELSALEHLSKQLNIPLCTLADESIHQSWQPNLYVQVVGNEFCWTHKVLPFKEMEDKVFVACINPFQSDSKQMLEFFLQKPIEFVLVLESELRTFLCQYAPCEHSGKSDVKDQHDSQQSIEVNNQNNIQEDEAEVDSAPIIKLCNKIVVEALNLKASDIHLEPSETGLDVRFRILGCMTNIFSISKKMQPYVITRLKILGGMDISDRRKPQDGRIKTKINGKSADIRVSSVPTAYGEKMVLRLLTASAYTKDFKSLGINERLATQLETALNQRGRMLLVTGPTGSGKSTTLYSCLQYLQNGTLNIETVEDPIEYRIKGANQIQVNPTAGVTFASALRSILRQDPDVIMVGEIRDEETALISAQAAQTGHLVLSTLHTNDAVSAVRRLEQLGCPNYLIADSLAGVMAQRLVRTICPGCKQKLSDDEYAQARTNFEKHGITTIPKELSKGAGCSQCHHSGFAGRTGVYSFLEVTRDIQELIANGASTHEITQFAQKSGFKSLAQNAYQLLEDQNTSFEEVLPILLSDLKSLDPILNLQTNKQASENIPGLIKKKLLLVEDDENLRQILALLLQKEMFEVIQAKNGQEALEQVYNKVPELVLCDLMMPIMDGREFLTRMKKNNQTAKIPIVMLTAADDENNEVDLIELGAEDFLSKGSSSNVMLSRLRKIIAQNI